MTNVTRKCNTPTEKSN